jgi:hypothetical protein
VVLAAIVAGLGTIFGSYIGAREAQSGESERQSQRLDEEVKGAARVLAIELLAANNQMSVIANDRFYRPFDSRYRIELPTGDLKLVASRLTTEQYAAILLALNSTDGLETFIRTQKRAGKHRLDARAVRLVRADQKSVADALVALQDLAGIEENDLIFAPYTGTP